MCHPQVLPALSLQCHHPTDHGPIHHLQDAEEPEGDQEGSVKAQQGRGCQTLSTSLLGQGPRAGAYRTVQTWWLLQTDCLTSFFGRWGCLSHRWWTGTPLFLLPLPEAREGRKGSLPLTPFLAEVLNDTGPANFGADSVTTSSRFYPFACFPPVTGWCLDIAGSERACDRASSPHKSQPSTQATLLRLIEPNLRRTFGPGKSLERTDRPQDTRATTWVPDQVLLVEAWFPRPRAGLFGRT
jgi:hypothetical protein